MNLSVSNIAWDPVQDDFACDLLKGLGIQYLELAPTRWWPDFAAVTPSQVTACRRKLDQAGLRVSALQSLLFGRPDLLVFSDRTSAACEQYLKKAIDLAEGLGAQALVFGSPKNHRKGNLSSAEAFRVAVAFFRSIGDYAAERNVKFCFEPNPAAYGADFGCTFMECAELVNSVDSPGFWINVDAGALTLNQENAGDCFSSAVGRLGYYHISEPFLDSFSSVKGNHHDYAAALGKASYQGFVSIEMKKAQDSFKALEEAIRLARHYYPC